MRKWILFLMTGVLLSACTTKEQDEKIKAFWGQQFLQVAMKFAGNMPTGAALPDMDKGRVAPAGSIDQKDMQDFEEMMKQWEQEQANLNTAEAAQPAASKTAPNTVSAENKNTAKARPSGKAAKPIRAYLVTSSSCGGSRQLQKDGWAEQFRDKYAGQIQLITYDVTTPQGQAGYQKLMNRYHRSSVGTPSLFLNGTVIEGYPLEGADRAAKRALAKSGRNISRQNSNQFIEITLEEPSGAVKGKAPLKDRKAMQREIDKVFQDNQNTVQDIGQAFGAGIQAQAFAITTKTEKALRRQASESASLQEYLKAQRQLLRKQEQSLNQLMQNNASMLRNVQ